MCVRAPGMVNVVRVTVGTYEGGVDSTVGVWNSRAGLCVAEHTPGGGVHQ